MRSFVMAEAGFHGEWRLGKFVTTLWQEVVLLFHGMIVSWYHGMAVLCQRHTP